jgi:acetylornithine deacetylase/succinyl-diaminopimelate desuccinylase-like protein
VIGQYVTTMADAVSAELRATVLARIDDDEVVRELLPRLDVGSIIGGRGRDHNLRGAYTVSDFCTAYVNVRFNGSQTGQTVVADIRRALDGLAAADPRFEHRVLALTALEAAH